jgi:hypothetical protein
MISHLVLFKPRRDLPGPDREALRAALERALRAIPEVRGARVGRRVRHGAGYEPRMPDAADYLAVIDFDDVAGLQAYLSHPVHEELGRRFQAALDTALIYDFEIGGLDRLASLSGAAAAGSGPAD